MNDLSYTQEFYLCATDKKGKVSSTEKICLAAGGISELLNGGYIKRDEKQRLIVDKPWDDTLPYIKPLYESEESASIRDTLEELLQIPSMLVVVMSVPSS